MPSYYRLADFFAVNFMPEWCSEVLILIAFFALIGLVFGMCWKTIRQILKLGWKAHKFTVLDVVTMLCGLFGILCIMYGLVEPYHLTVTRVSISSPKCRSSAVIRLVHITDLHCDGIQKTEKELARTIGELKPDLIVFTGDASNNAIGLKAFQDCMQEISRLAPTFGVKGNNDMIKEDVFVNSGVRNLDGKGELVTIKGCRIWITGVPANHADRLKSAMSMAPANSLNVFLYHYPAAILCDSVNKIDLLCVGHTHGGQVRLPLYGALITNSQVGKKYEYGLYHVGPTNMFVSRGIGTIGLPVRFLAPPEVAVIDISTNNGADRQH